MSRLTVAIIVTVIIVGQTGLVTAGSTGGTANISWESESSLPDRSDFDTLPALGGVSPGSYVEIADVASALSTVSDTIPAVLLAQFPSRQVEDTVALDNETRATVYEAVKESRASYLSELPEETGVPLSTVRYHIRILEEGLVQTERLDGKRWVFPANSTGTELEGALSREHLSGA